MKINAICVVKNEVDVIEETLLNAAEFCHRVYVFDNGSTDGTWEKIQLLANENREIEIAFHSGEVFKNQLRNRVYNKYHHLYSDDDWWYILDGDEMLTESPQWRLEDAVEQGKNAMHAWFAQFYFTDQDMENYFNEDLEAPVTERRRYYRVNWREVRFFKNHPKKNWPETLKGRIPSFCKKFHSDAPICRHYAERTPEQIKARVKLREHNPFSFFHVRTKKDDFQWIRSSKDLFYYENDGEFEFPATDKLGFYRKELGHWFMWRWKNLLSIPHRLARFATSLSR